MLGDTNDRRPCDIDSQTSPGPVAAVVGEWKRISMNMSDERAEGQAAEDEPEEHARYRLVRVVGRELGMIEEAIDRSKEILDYGDDFDGEGSPGYEAATWIRATELLRRMVRLYVETFGQPVPTPRVMPGPNGSIDIDWTLGDRVLLLNVPRDPNQHAGYFGKTETGITTKGKLDTGAKYEWVLLWLTQ
jgi:hypothetical protein